MTTPRMDSRMQLLPYCSVDAPIPEHDRNVLNEIYHSIPEIAEAATTQDGQAAIRNWLEDPMVAAGLIGFWEEE